MDIDSRLFAGQGARVAAFVGRKGVGQLIQFEGNGTICKQRSSSLAKFQILNTRHIMSDEIKDVMH